MAPHSSTLALKIPWMEEPGRLQSMGSQRVRHDWATSLSLFTFMHWRRKWQPTPVFLPGESQGWGSLVGCRVQSCPALCDSMDFSPPGPSVHGISQARILAWVAMPSSRGSSQSADRVCIIWVSCIGRRVLYHWATGKAVEQDPPVFFHYFWKENKSLIMQFYTRST